MFFINPNGAVCVECTGIGDVAVKHYIAKKNDETNAPVVIMGLKPRKPVGYAGEIISDIEELNPDTDVIQIGFTSVQSLDAFIKAFNIMRNDLIQKQWEREHSKPTTEEPTND